MKKIIIIIVLLVALTASIFSVKNHFIKKNFYTILDNYQQSNSSYQWFTHVDDTLKKRKVFYVTEDKLINIKIYSARQKGTADISVKNSDNVEEFNRKDIRKEDKISLNLTKGKYYLDISFNKYTGFFLYSPHNVSFDSELENDNFTVIKSSSDKGFFWDYILFTPENILSDYMLVIPNNSGIVFTDIDFHFNKAKQDIVKYSKLAESLGSPLLMPVFPRSVEDNIYYSHSLDRNTIMLKQEDMARLDLQLLAMIDDARERLESNGSILKDEFALYGFSAAGDFVDRFTFLHPNRVKAVALGGCNLMLPLDKYNNENLPFPIGTSDYKELSGTDFLYEVFSKIPRFIFTGELDEGGHMSGDYGVITGEEYFNRFELEDLTKSINNKSKPLFSSSNNYMFNENEIRYSAFKGAMFFDQFKYIQNINKELGLSNTTFKIYENREHEVDDEMDKDILDFFIKNL